MSDLSLAIVGLGTIARAQHLPAIAATEGITLTAVASRNARLDGVSNYTEIEELLESEDDVQAVSLCTPPQGRFEQAMAVLRADCHLMLEKPPGATLSELELLAAEANARSLTIFATWHSREAAAVDQARDWLADRNIHATHIDWAEDVRKWHPGQDWIWQPGGLGVFDPGINALSILTKVLPDPVRLTGADLHIPENRQTPIAAELTMDAGHPVTARLDWRQQGAELWQISFDTDAGVAVLDQGGARFTVDGETVAQGENAEYARLYARFRDLVSTGDSDLDLSPLRLVADAFLTGHHHTVPAFLD
ncbi:Gfo/Idh/MocA family protein [Paracoccus sp. JM45]|uniref:Gfo/Idh/MocA family protein n=1 Tax=Paracoccus sp. JM45 TaxID=2283626 RepID=UPI000E6BB701|nr:Gfo/Idh/MocA family oxidoreductase [Paracoccus sp. JM45]RJE79076.1 gfo/Idh/MocA family oxidoreductase [Paracoccus sp. JM45]